MRERTHSTEAVLWTRWFERCRNKPDSRYVWHASLIEKRNGFEDSQFRAWTSVVRAAIRPFVTPTEPQVQADFREELHGLRPGLTFLYDLSEIMHKIFYC